MESPRRDGQNKLAKNIKEQNLKFSVEFENGATAGHQDNTSKASSVGNQDNISKASNVGNSALYLNTKTIEETNSSTTEQTATTQVRKSEITRNEYSTKTDTNRSDEHIEAEIASKRVATKRHIEDSGKQATKRHTDDSRKQNKDFKLPQIVDSKTSPRESRSFGSRRSEQQKLEKPGAGGEIPIQARNRGPGPAHYLLPTTVGRNCADVTKSHSPSFSFGSRSWSFKTDSPGPAYNFDPLLGSKGKENRPSFSFGVRPKTPVRKNVTPGPGAYNTDRPPLWERKAPQYSISPRNKMRSVDNVPSPNVYQLPTTIGPRVPHQKGGPAVTLYGRREKHGFAEDLANTPGPARYGAMSPSLTKRNNPKYSVTGRNPVYLNKHITPGPGAYNPQNVNSHLEQSPRHVIGVRHSEFIMPTLTRADCD